MKTKAYLYIISAAVCWGLIGLFVRTLAAQGFSSMQIVAAASERRATICMELKPCAASVLTKSPIKPQQTAAEMI